MESVFSEIFSFRVPGGEVFMQRRFELSPDWAGGLKSLPIVSDRSTSDTLFVLPADAVLLFRAGALTLPAGAPIRCSSTAAANTLTPRRRLWHTWLSAGRCLSVFGGRSWMQAKMFCSSPNVGPLPLPRAFLV